MESMISVPGFTVGTEWDCIGNGVQTLLRVVGTPGDPGVYCLKSRPCRRTFKISSMYGSQRTEAWMFNLPHDFGIWEDSTCSKRGDWPALCHVLPRSRWGHSQTWGRMHSTGVCLRAWHWVHARRAGFVGHIRGPLRELQWSMLKGSIVLICISRKIYILVGFLLTYLLGYFYSSTGNQISLLPLHSGSQKWRNCFLEFTLKNCLFIWLCCVLVVACELFQLQHVGSSSLTRDWTWAPCTGNVESQPLGNPEVYFYNYSLKSFLCIECVTFQRITLMYLATSRTLKIIWYDFVSILYKYCFWFHFLLKVLRSKVLQRVCCELLCR